MSDPPDALDFGEMLQSLLHGWRWIGATFVVALLVGTAGVILASVFIAIRHPRICGLRWCDEIL